MTMHRLLPALVLLASIAPTAQALDSPWLSRLLLNSIPQFSLDATRLPALPNTAAPSTALDYARSVAVDISSQSAGRWQVDNGQASWRLTMHSDKARSMSVSLADMQLPEQATLRLFDAQGQLWHGPFSAEQLQQHARFWSPIVPGDSLLLELRVPAAEQDRTQLHIRSIQHGDHDWDVHSKSGSCNIDVACSTADAWTDAVRATARITIGGQRLCSAVLLNNTAQDGKPLLLTANHCGIGEDPSMGAESVVVYWNYQTSRCGGSPDGNLRQNQTGSRLLASNAESDFALVQLDNMPRAAYDVFYAGWDAGNQAPASGVSVHHPGGDEKRISVFNQTAAPRSASVDGKRVKSWQVFWDQGITENGSSGSGLWNSQHRVVGQLSGGTSSCSNQDSADVYGRLNAGWQAGSSNAQRLQPWLDPQQTGQLTLDGKDSRNGLNARSDNFDSVPADSQAIALDVLTNDLGIRPLRLLGAQAQHGQVQVDGQRLIYRFADNQPHDDIEYQLVDRWGESTSGRVFVAKPAADTLPVRGGSLDWLLLLVLLPAARRLSRARG